MQINTYIRSHVSLLARGLVIRNLELHPEQRTEPELEGSALQTAPHGIISVSPASLARLPSSAGRRDQVQGFSLVDPGRDVRPGVHRVSSARHPRLLTRARARSRFRL